MHSSIRRLGGSFALPVIGQRSRAVQMLLLALVAATTGCRAPSDRDSTTLPREDENSTPESNQNEADDATPDAIKDIEIPQPHVRWLAIEQAGSDVVGGWASGAVLDGNKVVIDTQDVTQFTLDLSQMPVDWGGRVVLKIDGHTSELTRKRYPTLRLRRSPSGGWVPVDDDDR